MQYEGKEWSVLDKPRMMEQLDLLRRISYTKALDLFENYIQIAIVEGKILGSRELLDNIGATKAVKEYMATIDETLKKPS
jgi:hypothetical protein